MENKLRRPFGILSRISTLIPLLNFSSCIDSHQNCAIRCHRTPLSSDTSYLKRLGCRAFDLGQQQAQHQMELPVNRLDSSGGAAVEFWVTESHQALRPCRTAPTACCDVSSANLHFVCWGISQPTLQSVGQGAEEDSLPGLQRTWMWNIKN